MGSHKSALGSQPLMNPSNKPGLRAGELPCTPGAVCRADPKAQLFLWQWGTPSTALGGSPSAAQGHGEGEKPRVAAELGTRRSGCGALVPGRNKEEALI